MSEKPPFHIAAPENESILIRSAPPKPHRLSGKALLAASLALGGVVAFAVIGGLSPNAANTRAPAKPAAVAAHGPPETVLQAAAAYAPESFAPSPPNGSVGLAQPSDPFLQTPDPPPSTPGASASNNDANANANAAPTPDHHRAPILFDRQSDKAKALPTDPDRLDEDLRAPPSRFTIAAGDIIAAALVTAINADLPGQVVARVTSPVFDSLTGDHILIPAGSRLIGAYVNGARYGDQRVLLVWERLILPNGWSLRLDRMAATDGAGAAGLPAQVDNNLDRLAGAIAMSALLSVAANEAEGRDDRDRRSPSLGDAAAQQAAQTGGKIVDRDLSVRPTLRVAAGAPVRVLVSRDIVLRPYQP
jgi:type IV secretion system protein TrbI